MVAVPSCLATLVCPPGTIAIATKTGEGEQCERPEEVRRDLEAGCATRAAARASTRCSAGSYAP
jgi:hypothetical protein